MDTLLEKSIIDLITKISNNFGNEVVLKGGMSLRLLGIERSTIDIDLIFHPYKSRKDFSVKLLKFLETICDEKPKSIMDSRKFQILCKYNGSKILVEPSAEKNILFQFVSTGDIAYKLGLEPCVIPIIDNSYAFSNKLGAWLERRMIRDLYDIYVYNDILKVKPNKEILLQRIQKPKFIKKIHIKPQLKTILEFLDFLKQEIANILPNQIEEELEGIIPENYLQGIGQRILTSIRMLNF